LTGTLRSSARAAVAAALILLAAASPSQATTRWQVAGDLPPAPQPWTLLDVAIGPDGQGIAGGQQGSRAAVIREGDGGWARSYLARASLGTSRLSAVTTAAGEAYAAGSYTTADGDRTLVVRFTGTRWERMGSRDRPGSTDLYGIAARGPDDVWAVGSSSDDGFLTTSTVIEHWNGRYWKLVRSPNPDDFQNELTHVAAGRDGALFATGHTSTGTLLVHRSHGRWHAVAVPTPAGFDSSFLEGLAVRSRDDVWLAGYGQRSSDGQSRPLAAHWNGAAWSLERLPNVPPQSFLSDIARPASPVAVGSSFSDFGSTGVAEELVGSAWQASESAATTGLVAVAAGHGRVLAVGQSPDGDGIVEERVP
jgi:hypothetical protein